MKIPWKAKKQLPSGCPTPEQDEQERQRLVGLCDRYLAKKNVILWGRAFDLNEPSSRLRAAEWLAHEMTSVFTQRRAEL